jgi:S-formylglutathione hydrolase FrmB
VATVLIDFYSRELKMSTLVTVIAPDSIRIGQKPLSERKCLHFLHGLTDDSTAALRLSRIELFAREADIVVVLPSVGRSMYCDGVLGQNYFAHVADEVPEYLHLMMGLSRRREDNHIAGISMGGMGAAKVALTYPERYASVALFSGLLDVKQLMPVIEDWHRVEFPFLFEEEVNIDTTPLNPINLLDAEKHKDLDILVRCGKQDDLYGMSLAFYEKAKALGLRAKGIFEDGAHEWRLWDGYIDDYIGEIGDS